MIACPSCGRTNENHYRFCLGCGTPLGSSRPSDPAAAADPLAGWGGLDAAPEPTAARAAGASPPVVEKSGWSMGSLAGNPRPTDDSWRAVVSGTTPAGGAPVSTGPGAKPARERPTLAREAYSPTAAAMPATPLPIAGVATPAQAPAPGPAPRSMPSMQPVRLSPVQQPVLLGSPEAPETTHAQRLGGSPVVAAADPPAGGPAGGAGGPSFTAPQSTGGPAVTSTVRKCSQCQALIPEGFAFCGQCGARWVEAPAVGRTMFLAGAPALVEERPVGRLVALRPDGSPGDAIALRDGETTLGRESTIAFPTDRLLSPRHATLYFRNGRLHIRDESSLNGVFLRLTGEFTLESGDVFRIGQQLLRYDDKRDIDHLQPPLAGDDTYVLGSPDLGYWGRLVQILTRTRVGNVYLLAGPEVTLGRERAQIAFPFDGFVSSTHAAILRSGDTTRLVDRNSSNGTYVRVQGEAPLESGSLVLVGQNLLRVELF